MLLKIFCAIIICLFIFIVYMTCPEVMTYIAKNPEIQMFLTFGAMVIGVLIAAACFR